MAGLVSKKLVYQATVSTYLHYTNLFMVWGNRVGHIWGKKSKIKNPWVVIFGSVRWVCHFSKLSKRGNLAWPFFTSVILRNWLNSEFKDKLLWFFWWALTAKWYTCPRQISVVGNQRVKIVTLPVWHTETCSMYTCCFPGETGLQGPSGPKGDKGDSGRDGIPGSTGERGQPG